MPLLLAAWPEVRARIPGARLRLVGRPPGGTLPTGVEATNEVASVASELRQASLFALPSFQEGFGIVVAEALASGVPAVVTPCGGPEELIRESGAGTVLADFEPRRWLLHWSPHSATSGGWPSSARAVVHTSRRHHSPARFREALAAAFLELDHA